MNLMDRIGLFAIRAVAILAGVIAIRNISHIEFFIVFAAIAIAWVIALQFYQKESN